MNWRREDDDDDPRIEREEARRAGDFDDPDEADRQADREEQQRWDNLP